MPTARSFTLASADANPSTMTMALPGLAPYVPRVARDWDPSPDVVWRSVEGTLLFVDISGFTALSERLARKGRIGAEELTGVLDGVFGRMLDVAAARGGSLLKFGGDALLLLFDTPGHPLQACAAAVEMRSALRDASSQRTSVGKLDLRMSSGVHTGIIDLFLVGASHRELIVTGPAATATTAMESAAGAGEILVSDGVKEVLPPDYAPRRKGEGWLLSKRVIDLAPAPTGDERDVTEAALSALVPQRLRDFLRAGDPDSEHRLATIGFIEFQGIDELIDRVGPDEVARRLSRLVELTQAAAEREDVTFLSSDIDGDGGKIIFVSGVPTSLHDDEGRMLRSLREVLDSDVGLDLKAGASRGHVFSGTVGTPFRHTYTVMGDTVNLAARLMAAASTGELYATPAVLDRSATLFRTEALEPFLVKGKTEPVRAYTVHEDVGVRPPALEHELPFHGRDIELQMIVGIVTTCARVGRGGMMTISGQVGVGKSRLIAEVLEECPGLATLVVQAEPNGSENPYWAFRDPMRRLLGIERGDQETMASDLVRIVAERAPLLLPTLPLLGDVLHIDVGDNDQTAAIEPRFRPDRTADAIVSLLETTGGGPFALIAEDGQWLDPASLGLVEKLGEAARERPWTVMVTAREVGEAFTPLGDELELRPLSDDAVRAIAIDATAATPLRPHELDAVVERSGGNPLFLSEILNMIASTGDFVELPDSLDAVVSTQIDTLPPSSRQLLRYSAVLGRSFRRVVLERFLAPDEIIVGPDALEELGQFMVTDDPVRIEFRHALVHEIAYQGLSYRRRRELHGRAGDVIEAMAGDDPDGVAEYLAGHYSTAGRYDKAWRYSRIAAEKARSTYATTEATAQYRRAIEAAKHVTDADPIEISDMWTRLGEVQDLAGVYEGARDSYRHALRLASGHPVRVADLHIRRAEAWYLSGKMSQAKRELTMARRALEPSAGDARAKTLARLAAYEASVHAGNGDPVAALRSAGAAIDQATLAGDEESCARAYTVMDWANFVMGIEAPRQGEKAVEIYQRLGLLERSVAVLNNLGAFAYYEGDWAQAMAWYAESVDAADRSGNVVVAANTRTAMAEVYNGQRRFVEAIPLTDEAQRVIRSSNAVEFLPFVRLQSARATAGIGRVDEAETKLRELFDEQLSGGDTEFAGETAVALAEVLIGRSRPAEAIDVLDRLEKDAADAAPEAATGVFRSRGRALVVSGALDEGMDWLQRSLVTAREESDLYGELLALEALHETDPASTDTEDLRIAEIAGRLGIEDTQPAEVQLASTT